MYLKLFSDFILFFVFVRGHFQPLLPNGLSVYRSIFKFQNWLVPINFHRARCASRSPKSSSPVPSPSPTTPPISDHNPFSGPNMMRLNPALVAFVRSSPAARNQAVSTRFLSSMPSVRVSWCTLLARSHLFAISDEKLTLAIL